MGRIYDRRKYINEYHLNVEEIALLPLDIRLAYINQLYRSSVTKAIDSQEEECFKGFIHPVFFPYFEKCGCQVTNYDFGDEEYSVKSVRKSDYTVDPKYVALALDYTKEVAHIRSTVFEITYEDILNNAKDALKSGVLESNPNLEALENILKSPLSSGLISKLLTEVIAKQEIRALGTKPNEEVSMSTCLPKVYRDILIKEGYEITKKKELNKQELIVRKLRYCNNI